MGQLFAAGANAIWTELNCCCCCFVACCRSLKRRRDRNRIIKAKTRARYAELGISEKDAKEASKAAKVAARERERKAKGAEKAAREAEKAAKKKGKKKKKGEAEAEEEGQEVGWHRLTSSKSKASNKVAPAEDSGVEGLGTEEVTEEELAEFRRKEALQREIAEVVVEETDVELETKEFNRLGKRNVDLPLGVGFILIIVWIAFASWFFHYTEGWSYPNCIYFMFISVTTIGFGDFGPVKWELAAAQFFFIFMGLSLFSLCIALVQQSLEKLQDNIQESIFEQYKASLESGTMQEGATVEDMVKKQGGVKRFLLSKKAMKQLGKEYDKAAGMKTVATQTPVKHFADASVMIKETMFRYAFLSLSVTAHTRLLSSLNSLSLSLCRTIYPSKDRGQLIAVYGRWPSAFSSMYKLQLAMKGEELPEL